MPMRKTVRHTHMQIMGVELILKLPMATDENSLESDLQLIDFETIEMLSIAQHRFFFFRSSHLPSFVVSIHDFIVGEYGSRRHRRPAHVTVSKFSLNTRLLPL